MIYQSPSSRELSEARFTEQLKVTSLLFSGPCHYMNRYFLKEGAYLVQYIHYRLHNTVSAVLTLYNSTSLAYYHKNRNKLSRFMIRFYNNNAHLSF